MPPFLLHVTWVEMRFFFSLSESSRYLQAVLRGDSLSCSLLPLFFLSNILVTAALFMPTALTVTSIKPLHGEFAQDCDSVPHSLTARHLLLDLGLIM